ncbi:hypothetical protein BGP77_05575 [Saccharospirillum sp. MSK14-1]|uniref:Hpt domain-containing protein n=1 Tax=Saccharospirillum sp. MSK14-1 TaxID=1897632 RepID=UPI000D332C7C|nr:Hpt domain-containing protein [Saccharospirillum sp. MSK14-1]PTY36758.1 hypothetical protein BGP77_05575 [Saccharospirillum sp. MSK14-1]
MTADQPDQHLDDAALTDLRDLLEDDFSDLIETFLGDARERYTELVALNQHPEPDAQTVRGTAHSFKGSCLNVGVTRLAQLCRRLEEMANADQLDSVDSLLADIGTELTEVERLLRSQYL